MADEPIPEDANLPSSAGSDRPDDAPIEEVDYDRD